MRRVGERWGLADGAKLRVCSKARRGAVCMADAFAAGTVPNCYLFQSYIIRVLPPVRW